jgi:ribosomal protein S18
MKQTQVFLEFEKLQKELDEIINSRDNKRFGNKISFLSHLENAKYINWKSIVILKKYLTRFGSIKPRKYTKNCVNTQKQLRKEIIRARGLGLLEFIKQ